MKLGYIDYLNCYPFYFHMLNRKKIEKVDIIPGYPSELNRKMAVGDLDVSPISAAAYAGISEDVSLIPDFCLSSVGYVGSIVLRSKIPIEELHEKNVGVTRTSQTSVILLKMLLKKYYHADPVYSVTDPNPTLDDLDAALLIGNEAMVASPEPVSYSYDLGELWLRKTGFPVVFAVFVIRNEVLDQYHSEISEVIKSYHKSLRCLELENQQVVCGARERYPEIIYDLKSYYNVLKFHFTDELKKALRFYLDTAADLGLLRENVRINYISLD